MSRPGLLDALVSRHTSRAFGEAVVFTPRLYSPYGGACPDPAFPPHKVVGNVAIAGGAGNLQGTRRGTEFQGTTTAAVAQSSVLLSAETIAKLGERLPKKGDMLELVDRPSVPRYNIARASPSDLGDLLLTVTIEDVDP